jgi:hypothetical protein
MIKKEFGHETNVYNRAIIFLYGTRTEINAWGLKHRDDSELVKPECSGNWSLYMEDGVQIDVISIVEGFGPVVQLGSLVHEVCHHAVYVFTARIGTAIKDQQDEPFCYYVQHIVGLCLDAIVEGKKRQKKKHQRGEK